MTNDSKLKPSEHATRALAGVSQGIRGAVLPGAAGLGLLSIAPLARKLVKDTSHVPKAYRTETIDQLTKLTDKILRAGGRNPDMGRPIFLDPVAKPGAAEVIQEYIKPKGQKKARDILRIGLNANPESIAHEVGHITPKTTLGKILSKVSPVLRSRPAQAVPAALAASALLGKYDEDAPAISKAAPYVGGAQLATIMAEETRANLRGSNILKRMGYKSPLKQRIGRHIASLPYLHHAALLIGAPIGILKGLEAFKKAKQKQRPMSPEQLLARSPEQLANLPTTQELQEKWAPLFNSR